MRYNHKVAQDPAASSPSTVQAATSPALAALVAAAAASGLSGVSVTWRRTAGTLHTWASTHHARTGWEALGAPLDQLAREAACTLVTKDDGWGQVDVDVAAGSAEMALVHLNAGQAAEGATLD